MILPFHSPPWAVMWLLALTLYAVGKAITLAAASPRTIPPTRKLAYLLLFPGMNAGAFCTAPARAAPSSFAPAFRYAMNVVLGVILLWWMAGLVPPHHPLVQGWTGMIGLILLLHFGILQLIALAWQAAGFNAPPIMNRPLRSASVTEFWSVRWNTAFHQLSHQFVFKPLARRSTPRVALLLTFTASGIVHDLVISLPAGAGFGLPTAYFILQALAVLFEHSVVAKRFLHRPLAARAFALAVVALPAPMLFHAAFVTRVMLPFMVMIGALPSEVQP